MKVGAVRPCCGQNSGVSSDFPTVDVTYDEIGNPRSRTDAGTMEYGEPAVGAGRKIPAGPHAVTSLTGRLSGPNLRYSYDLRGNRTKTERFDGSRWRTDVALTYNIANLPTLIASPTPSAGGQVASSTFNYAPSRSRYQQVQKVGSKITLTRLYVGGLYEREKRGTVLRHVQYIPAGGGTVAILQSEEGAGAAPERTLYVHKDHLGSVETLTDQNGVTQEHLSYDAWGRRRTVSVLDSSVAYKPADPSAQASDKTSRGFTGHEMLDAFGSST